MKRCVEERVERGKIEAEPRAWATILGGALYKTIEFEPADSTIGGKIMCYVLDGHGVHGWGISRTKVGQKLEKVSLKHDQAKTHKQKWAVPPASEYVDWKEFDNPIGKGPFATKL